MGDDPSKLLDDLGDLDWDSALDEWEKNTFVPQVARDAETNRVAPPVEGEEGAPPKPLPAAGAKPGAAQGSLGNVSSEGTVIAPVPSELRDVPRPPSSSPSPPAATTAAPPAAVPAPPAPPRPVRPSASGLAAPTPPPRASTFPGAARGGGLGQLFSRGRESMPVPPPTPPARKERTGLDLFGDSGFPSDSATVVADRAKLDSLSDAETATRLPGEESGLAVTAERPAPDAASPADDEAPTFMRSAPSQAPSQPAFPVEQELEGEREPEAPPVETPPSRWLDETATATFRQRALWLEEEARALESEADRARALLAVSEIYAIAGDRDAALAFAIEARDVAPELPLAWRQARQLMEADPQARVEALDAEAARSPTPAARAHATLMAADILRTNGDGDGAMKRWNSACRLDPADVRAPAARAALALAHENHTIAGADLAENSELVALDRAVAMALRLRGSPRPGTDIDLAMPINDGLRRARTALVAGDVVTAAQAIADIAGAESALAKAALWLSAALGATHIAARRAAARSLKTLASEGEELARRQLAARGIELGDPELISYALSDDDAPFEAAERASLLALAGQDHTSSLDWIDDDATLAPLSDALSALAVGEGEGAVARRAGRTSGAPEARALASLGRLLASQPEPEVIDEALASVPSPRSPAAAGVALETAVRARRWDEVATALSSLPAGDDASAVAQRHIAAALVAERAGNREGAARAWREALSDGAAHDSVVRAVASLDAETDLAAELVRIADDMTDGPAPAILRLEALARSEGMSDEDQMSALERVHRGAPGLGIGAFLAERIGRKKGDVDEVLRWLQERRSHESDPFENALDAVREALLVADRDPELAGTRLEEAHRGRPDDVALRELYERLSSEPPSDRGAWREKRAEKATGPTRALLFTEAALEHERSGDHAAAERAAKAALGPEGEARSEVRDALDLVGLVLARAEVESGNTSRQADALVALAKETSDAAVRLEAYERLADLDGFGRKDRETALVWHRTILEEAPQHKPSLRFVEHSVIGEGKADEVASIFERIARALDGSDVSEVSGHAQLSARITTRTEGGWARTGDLARLAATQGEPSLWSLRALNAHARVKQDEETTLKTTLALLERTQRPPERAALLLRASEAAARLEQVADARAYLEQAASEDPGDVMTWGFLAEVRERAGETRAAAEACESLARTSVVPEHQLLAWYDAARIWLDEVSDSERGMTALEQCAEIDVTHADVFTRLSAAYAASHLDAELARLLEKRLASVEDQEEKVLLEVELARALGEMGELAKAKSALESALAERPEHTTALGAMADLCAKEGDWQGAEQAYVRLARLLATPEEQRAIYEKLGEIYSVHTVNLSRAEVAYREVLKRVPNDMPTLEKLVDIYKRQGDIARAIETAQEIVAEATDPAVRLRRLVELAEIHETAGRDARRAEQVLESARKEFPTSVVALRAMAEFYARQRQMPAMQILLDRAAGDARRSFAAGRFVTSLFEVLHAAYELRGKKDAARVVAATLAAVEGHPAEIVGAEARAVDPRLDDVLAPDVVSPALRALLARTGDSLDAIAPMDLRSLRATPLVPGTPLGTTVGAVATVVGLGALQILVSPQLGRVAIPLGSNPPTLLVGEGLMHVANERARAFVVVRAMKMIPSRSSALLRGEPADVAVLVSALFTALNPSFAPQGVDAKKVAETSKRLVPALPRNLDPTVGVIALEAAGTLGAASATLAAGASAWANRVALIAIGDPNGALDAIAWSKGEEAAPKEPDARAAWIARTVEARELMTFSVTDGYSEARARLGLDR